ncbi:MAG: protein translocase subunit SecD, partial [Betaproteobacteria bacterium]|nr:protein translocase subunit SecD [Betaproteobacteria bacterium]
MNKLALWRLAVMALALAFGLLYSLPNLFGEAPAVQVSSAKATVKVEPRLAEQVEAALAETGVAHKGVVWEANAAGNTLRVRFDNTDLQLRGKDALEKSLN